MSLEEVHTVTVTYVRRDLKKQAQRTNANLKGSLPRMGSSMLNAECWMVNRGRGLLDALLTFFLKQLVASYKYVVSIDKTNKERKRERETWDESLFFDRRDATRRFKATVFSMRYCIRASSSFSNIDLKDSDRKFKSSHYPLSLCIILLCSNAHCCQRSHWSGGICPCFAIHLSFLLLLLLLFHTTDDNRR